MKKNTLLSQFGVSEIELSYKSKVKPSERPKIICSKDAYNILINTWDKDKLEFVEQFKVILLNRSNSVLGIVEISTGGPTGTVADPKTIIASAVLSNACSLMLSHNHPSGSVKPSRADDELTHKIKEAAKYHDLRVLDHLIVSSEEYFSFADEGLM